MIRSSSKKPHGIGNACFPGCYGKMRMLISPNQNRLFNRSAFTLTEQMTALAIICLVFTVLHVGIAQSFAVIRTCRESLRATQILEEKMETVRLYNWDQINDNGSPPDNTPFIPRTISDDYDPNGTDGHKGVHYTGTLTVSDSGISEAYSGDLKLFVATLDWTNGGVTHHREMRTFASRWGLQNYVYPIK